MKQTIDNKFPRFILLDDDLFALTVYIVSAFVSYAVLYPIPERGSITEPLFLASTGKKTGLHFTAALNQNLLLNKPCL